MAHLSHIQGAATVVVGAGVVGLCIARELALEMKQANLEHRIVVIEIKESYCELASGHCAGFISTSGIPDDWESLVDEARQWWLDIVESADMQERLLFDPKTAIRVAEGGAMSKHKIPSWLRQDAGLSLSRDSDAIGRV